MHRGLPRGPDAGFEAVLTEIRLRPQQSIPKASLVQVIVLLASVFIVTAGAAHAQALSQSSDPFQRIFARLYNYDFAGAHSLLARLLLSTDYVPIACVQFIYHSS
jgi:hypothetical protein